MDKLSCPETTKVIIKEGLIQKISFHNGRACVVALFLASLIDQKCGSDQGISRGLVAFPWHGVSFQAAVKISLRLLLLVLWLTSSARAERINQEGRILGASPAVTNAILFNTNAARMRWWRRCRSFQ